MDIKKCEENLIRRVKMALTNGRLPESVIAFCQRARPRAEVFLKNAAYAESGSTQTTNPDRPWGRVTFRVAERRTKDDAGYIVFDVVDGYDAGLYPWLCYCSERLEKDMAQKILDNYRELEEHACKQETA